MHKILSHKSLSKSCKLSIWPIRFVQAPASHHRVLPVSIPLSAASSVSAAQSINPVLQRPQGKQGKKISPRSSGRGVNRWRGKKCPLQRRIITMGKKTTRVLNRAHSHGLASGCCSGWNKLGSQEATVMREYGEIRDYANFILEKQSRDIWEGAKERVKERKRK